MFPSEKRPKVRYSDLEKIPGHKNFYRNPVSKKIYFKRDGNKIATGVTQILKAKLIAEQKMAELRADSSKFEVEMKQTRVKSPHLAVIWCELVKGKTAESEPSTMKNYHKSWAYGFGPFWRDKTVFDLTDENVLKFKSWYLENNPTRKFEHTYVHFSMLVRFAKTMKLISDIPDLRQLANLDEIISKNSKREKVGRVYTVAEIDGFIKAADKLKFTKESGTTSEHKMLLSARAALGILLGGKCGLRKMEALKLLCENVDQKKGVMKVWSQKNHKWRDVPLTKELIKAFNVQMARTEKSKWVFPMPSDPTRHISSQVFDKVWVQVKSISGIQGRARFHDLRHTFASKTAEDNWPPITACEVLDMSLEIYQGTYAKTSSAKKAEMMQKSFGK